MPTGIYKRTQEMYLSRIGVKHSEEHKRKISESNTGKKVSEKTKAKLKIALIGKNFGKHHSLETRKKISEASKNQIRTVERNLKISLSKKGKKRPILSLDKHWNWKGGITPLNKKIRMSMEMDLWRESVFKRDNWTCQKYGIRGGVLRAHHVFNYHSHPELRFIVDNGVTLSEKAHKKFHRIYGNKNNTRKQLQEFLTNK